MSHPTPALTEREHVCLQALAEGLTDDAAARTIEISARTYRRSIQSVVRKLNAYSRTHAVALAAASGLVVVHPRTPQADPIADIIHNLTS